MYLVGFIAILFSFNWFDFIVSEEKEFKIKSHGLDNHIKRKIAFCK